ncbi:extracellular solute-binding protein [Nocardioides zeae]
MASAEDEGSVMLYTAQLPENLAAFEEAFEEAYDIDLTVVRANGPDNTARIEQERESGRVAADVWVETDVAGLESKARAGDWFAPVVGPGFEAGPVADLLVEDGSLATVGAVAVVAGWNTDLVPDGLADYPDLLAPELAGGKIGLVEPVAPAQVDLYLWMQETFGDDYLERLAAQEPRIYPSTVPMGQALASGEIAASPGVLPQAGARATGAPVDSVVSPSGVWATRYFAAVLQEAPHPNAAQVLTDFMVSEEGQAAINKEHPAVLDDIPGTLSGMADVRPADAVAALDADDIAEFQAEWDRLFG